MPTALLTCGQLGLPLHDPILRTVLPPLLESNLPLLRIQRPCLFYKAVHAGSCQDGGGYGSIFCLLAAAPGQSDH